MIWRHNEFAWTVEAGDEKRGLALLFRSLLQSLAGQVFPEEAE